MTTISKAQEKNKLSDIDENISKLFDIKKRLGKGAYGIVWKAVDKRTNETLAVKKIFDAFRDETDAQRTFREICFLQSFRSHPNVVKMLNVFRASNNLDIYLVFEYMESDLHNIIKKGSILKDVHKCFIMYQLLNAIKYIHSGNVIHRDLKPSNILIDSKCRCKLADFGLARSLSSQPSRDAQEPTEYGGAPLLTDYVATRWYRAPEILVASKRYTKGIDMWSLGCILGEMIRGKPLFQGTSTINQIEKIICALPHITESDINAVGVSFGSVLLSKPSSTEKKTSLEELMPDAPSDALDMVKSLLLLDPLARLTATEAIDHHYVERFRHSMSEVELEADILPPFRDDIRLTVSEYRTKLYEIAQSTNDPNQRPTHSSSKRNTTTSKRISSISQAAKPRESKYLEKTDNSQICKKISKQSLLRLEGGLSKTTILEDDNSPNPIRKPKHFEANKAPNRNRIIEDLRNMNIAQSQQTIEKKLQQQMNNPRSKNSNKPEYQNNDKRHSIDGGYGSLPVDNPTVEHTSKINQSKIYKSSSITKLNGNERINQNPVIQQRLEKSKPTIQCSNKTIIDKSQTLQRSSSVIMDKVPHYIIPNANTKSQKVTTTAAAAPPPAPVEAGNFCYHARIKKIEAAVAGFKDDIRKFAKESKYHLHPLTPIRSVPTMHSQYQQAQTRYPQARSKYTSGNIGVMQPVMSMKMSSTITQMVPTEGATNSNTGIKRSSRAFNSLQRERTYISNIGCTGGSGDHRGRDHVVTSETQKSNDCYKNTAKIQQHQLHQQRQQQQSRNRISSKAI